MSLKHMYADEIAAAMAKSLEDEAFLGQFRKEAAASNEDILRDAIAKGDKEHCTSLYNRYFAGGEGDTALQAELSAKYGDDKAMAITQDLRGALYKICNPGPGSTFPVAADDKCEKCHCEECKCEKPEKEEKEEDCMDCGDMDKHTEMALAFAMDHLVKVANALDNHGFAGVAEVVDEAVEKLAAKKGTYKTWKGKGEKPPKGAEHKAPKAWWDKMEKDVKKKNPDYSAKRVREIVGDIWDNELTDAKRESIVKKNK